MIYLDNAGTTAPDKECIRDFNDVANIFGNPSSTETDLGTKANNIITTAQYKLLDFIGGLDKGNVYFTSSGSEANTWAIRGVLDANPRITSIITTRLEHSSTYNCIKFMRSIGYKVIYLSIDNNGVIDMDELEDACKRNPYSLVSIMLVNNETGGIQDLDKISKIAHKYDCIVHSDCVQALGHVCIDTLLQGFDLATFSGHKINCFKGIGALFAKKDIWLNPLIYGGKQMDGLRGGTENIPYIYCFGGAIERARDFYGSIDICDLGRYFEGKLNEYKINHIINCESTHSFYIYSVILKDLSTNTTAADLMNILAYEHQIYTAVGSACNSGSNKPSRVLKEIGLSDEDAKKTIRISFSNKTTIKEIDEFVETLSFELDMLKE